MSALSMDSGYLALVAPPQRVSEETRREIINRRGLKRCVYDIGGRAMFDASGAFIGCDRQPERRLVRKAEREMSHRRHLDPMIEAAYQRRLALRRRAHILCWPSPSATSAMTAAATMRLMILGP